MYKRQVASLFENVPGLGPSVTPFSRLEAAVLLGAKQFSSVFYRGQIRSITGLSDEGALLMEGVEQAVDNPEEIDWSIV